MHGYDMASDDDAISYRCLPHNMHRSTDTD